ncbi:C2H2 type zinc finger domain protein [Aspergillus ellipticus CBS 707.79]|uniref:C2H2 type zinc finger domain protein n=1 Tax=Aspergillus ellipticus CBS 707.79 TaxID=1448320 RepID=A0A319DPZ3_9EURO|nr:C2H2 type zinc finger domain protein [Aspergillus ellipticus CBS 707.79]
MSVSGSNKPWGDSGDILQGIMGTRAPPPPSQASSSQAELLPDGLTPSDVMMGDPASFLGFQFASDPAIPPPTHGSILPPWLPFHTDSSSANPLNLDQPPYPFARLRNEHEAWNPLQLTGLAINNSAYKIPPTARNHPVYGLDRRFSTGHYSTPSEAGSQYTSLHPSDSGYSTRSCATRSVAASYALDSACSPYLGPLDAEQDDRVSALDLNSAPYGEPIDPMERMDSPSLLCQDMIKCDNPGCQWTGKCPSDKRKHEARHKKLFKCDEPNCTRKEGFGTINDLARHKKCVHKQEPERGPKVLYMCFGHNCPRRTKKWPRLDNFRQHLARMHNDEDVDDLLKKSHEWYETCVKPQEMGLIDRLSEEAPTLDEQTASGPEDSDAGHDVSHSLLSSQTVIPPSRFSTLHTAQGIDGDRGDQGFEDASASSTFAEAQPIELPTLRTVSLDQSLNQKVSIPTHFDPFRNGKMDDMVNEAAVNMINAMTKSMNTNQRRQSHQSEEGEELVESNAELSDRKREMLQRIFSAALDQLSGNPSPGHLASQEVADDESDKKGWIQCEVCTKRTRLRCEMKKHKKRHERPYGCTFHKCNKTFGSKADWKRHENSQHFPLQSWRCTLPDATQGGLSCARLFYRQDIYVQHLKKHHDVDEDEEVRVALCKNRIGRNGQSQFWCGFCQDIVPLQSQGLAARNERFNHIDIEHFKKGERIGDWLLPSGHLTKDRERQEKNIRADGNGYESEPAMDENSDEESASSDYHSDCEPLHEDMMVIDEESTPGLSLVPFSDSLQHIPPPASHVVARPFNLRKRKFPAQPYLGTEQEASNPEKRSRFDSLISKSDHVPQESFGSFHNGAHDVRRGHGLLPARHALPGEQGAISCVSPPSPLPASVVRGG